MENNPDHLKYSKQNEESSSSSEDREESIKKMNQYRFGGERYMTRDLQRIRNSMGGDRV